MKHLLRLDFFPPQHFFPDARGLGRTDIARAIDVRDGVGGLAHQGAEHVAELLAGEVDVAHHDHTQALGARAPDQPRDRFEDEGVCDLAGDFDLAGLGNALGGCVRQQFPVNVFQGDFADAGEQLLAAAQFRFGFGPQGGGDAGRTERLQRLQAEKHIGWSGHLAPQDGVKTIERKDLGLGRELLQQGVQFVSANFLIHGGRLPAGPGAVSAGLAVALPCGVKVNVAVRFRAEALNTSP
jgi:hypothetical protein